ncbi:MAG: DUF1080 domain-containing protein [Bacteroidales bacterium]
MKNLKNFLFIVLPAVFLFSCASEEDKMKTIALFNEENLDNWVIYAETDTVDLDTVWYVQDSVIHCTGNPWGYLRTKESYQDYKLHVEWRWPEEPGNSGVFVHVQGDNQLWPTCIEAQLWDRNAGDFVAMGESDFNERVDKTKRLVQKSAETAEVEPGGWNAYDIECFGDSIKLFVNDVLMNVATGVTVTSGDIALQGEGKPTEFKNVYIEVKEE